MVQQLAHRNCYHHCYDNWSGYFMHYNSSINRPRHEPLGSKPHNLCSYFPEPRTEFFCYRLNFNIAVILSLHARTTGINLSINERTSFLVLTERKAGSAPTSSPGPSPGRSIEDERGWAQLLGRVVPNPQLRCSLRARAKNWRDLPNFPISMRRLEAFLPFQERSGWHCVTQLKQINSCRSGSNICLSLASMSEPNHKSYVTILTIPRFMPIWTNHPFLYPRIKGALSQEFCCFQLHSLLKSLPGTLTRSQNAQMD